MSIAQNPHALAIIAALEADGLTVGDGQGKKTGTPPEERIAAPQVVVHMIPGGSISGPIDAPDGEADARFQLTAIGRIAQEARWVADKAAIALEAGLTVSGRSVQRVRPEQPWGSTLRDEDVDPPLFYSTRIYAFFTAPT